MGLASSSRSSPFVHTGNRVSWVMAKVLLALLFPLVFWLLSFTWAGLIQMVLAIATGLLCEWLALRMRRIPARPFLQDGSVVVAMVLLAFCIPPIAPWYVVVLAAMVAVLLAKHSYGGLGHNVFNPAMAGYAVVLISFPQEMALWPHVNGAWMAGSQNLAIDLSSSLDLIFSPAFATANLDAYTAATLLADLRHGLAEPIDNWLQQPWLWFNGFCLVGGLLLLWWRVISWHIPAAFLLAMGLMSGLLVLLGFSSMTDWLACFGLGAGMLAAFFVLTDPVSAATSPQGRLIYAAFAGVMVVLIRQWGNYPDSVAFAVLLANLLVPVLDRYCLPKPRPKRIGVSLK